MDKRMQALDSASITGERESIELSYDAIREALEQEAIENPKRLKTWTQEEIAILKEFKDKLTAKQIAKHLNRSLASVANKLTYLN